MWDGLSASAKVLGLRANAQIERAAGGCKCRQVDSCRRKIPQEEADNVELGDRLEIRQRRGPSGKWRKKRGIPLDGQTRATAVLLQQAGQAGKLQKQPHFQVTPVPKFRPRPDNGLKSQASPLSRSTL